MSIQTHLANSPALYRFLFHFGKVMIVGDYVGNNRFLVWVLHTYI